MGRSQKQSEEEVIPRFHKSFLQKLADVFTAIKRGMWMVEEMDVNYRRFTTTEL